MSGGEVRPIVKEQLRRALIKLRQRKGWQDDAKLLKSIPKELRSVLNIDTSQSEDVQRQRLDDLITTAQEHLPSDAREHVVRAFNRKGELQLDYLERLAKRAHEEHFSERQLRRNVDDAFVQLAAEVLLSQDAARDIPGAAEGAVALNATTEILSYARGYRTTFLDASLYITPDTVEIRETREIEAREDGVEYYVVSRTLYWPGTRVETLVNEGAHHEREHWPHDRFMLHLLRFPEPLQAGQRRRFVVTHKVTGMAPIYTTNTSETAHLTVRLQFRGVAPAVVWLLDGLPGALLRTEHIHQVLEEHAPRVLPDRFGYLEHGFETRLEAASGLAWSLPPASDDQETIADGKS